MAVTRNFRIISVLFLAYSSLMLGLAGSPALAQQTPALELADKAPDRHIVVPGDTLWGISAMFLKQPYRWPEIWHMNQEQIKNPHRIYPGQVVILDMSGSQPQLRLGNMVEEKAPPRIYSQDNKHEISSIPQSVIEPFLSQPLVVEEGRFDNAARIIATQEDRVVVGNGNLAYVTGITTKDALWQIYRPGKALVDPDTNQLIGYEAFYLGSARLLREGEPATVEIISARQEIGRDDRLVPAPRPQIINYVPHAPGAAVKGRIVSIYGAVEEGSTHSIVTLSRGRLDGLEVGHVLAVSRAGALVDNRFEGKLETYQLPDERYGLVFVFRVFDHVSYALVMNVSRPVAIGDIVANP